MLNKWYSEGLIDPDYLAVDRQNFESKAISNRVGAYFGMANGFMGKFQGIWEQDHPDYQLMPVPPAIAPDGKKYGLHVQSQIGNDGMAITTKNKYFKESITYFDYLYGEEGHMLAGYGIEGRSYEMVNGEPLFTDEILKNPDGIPPINALHKYNYSVGAGPCFQTEHIFSQMAQYPQVAATYQTWASDLVKLNLTNLSSTDEEGTQLAKIMGDINTYQEEMFHKFIMGQEPLSNYDAYVERIKSMDIDTAVQIYQNMLDRYLSK
jgi:putative aldouronate transport system substrate-binding protein